MAVACFNKLSFSTQTAWLFAPDKLLYRKIFMGAAQTRNFWKNWVNFFAFWEDNLALAKFQCPTDTSLNHNLLLLPQHLSAAAERFMMKICK